jgi:cytochrome c-type biogenesis protein CcmH
VRLLLALMMTSLLVCAGAAGAAVGARPDAGPDDGAGELLLARVQTFAQQIRCLVCQNETLAESQAELAVDLRREIREQMAAGRSDAQIVTFLTERYGDFVLYHPPLKPATYLLWFGPFVLLGGALIAMGRAVRCQLPHSAIRPLSPEERKRVRQLLAPDRREETV